MKVSARNQLNGKVSAIRVGQVNDEVVLDLGNGEEITAVVTKASVVNLELAVGKEAVALFKAPWVILAAQQSGLRFSARNAFSCHVEVVKRGTVNSIVNLITKNGTPLSAVVTNNSAEEMALSAGQSVIALIKASHVILAVKE